MTSFRVLLLLAVFAAAAYAEQVVIRMQGGAPTTHTVTIHQGQPQTSHMVVTQTYGYGQQGGGSVLVGQGQQGGGNVLIGNGGGVQPTVQISQPAGPVGKSIIVHMANRKGAVKWALDQGANGVELDLQFTIRGIPTEFRHGGACDCTCTCPFGCTDDGVCSALWSDVHTHCDATTPLEEMAEYLAAPEIRDRLAIVYINSFMDNSVLDYFGAGQRVVELLNKKTFANGYNGQVVIGLQNADYIDYLKGAVVAANASPYGNRYFYTLDGQGTDYMVAWSNLLTLNTKNIIYSTGISACFDKDFRDAIQGSKALNGYAGIAFWTVDKKTTMETYAAYGVNILMTQMPNRAVEVFGRENIAKPGNALRPVDRDLPFEASRTCDCSYRNQNVIKLWGGGCILRKMAPPGSACKCYESAPYTCDGTVVPCLNAASVQCKDPTGIKDTCLQGGGECGGY